MRYPPYNETNMKRLSVLLKETNFPSFKVLSYILVFGLGVASAFICQEIAKVSFHSSFHFLSYFCPVLFSRVTCGFLELNYA